LAFAGRGGFEPGGKVVVDEHIQFKMHVRAVFGDDFALEVRPIVAMDLADLELFADFQSGGIALKCA